jgi:putative FmdB family regulatory protein
VPLYEYFCPSCNQKFELLRPMSRAEEPATCPSGHPGANRVLSLFASFSRGDDGSVTAVGGNPCASCALDSCGTCDIPH